MRRRLSPFTVRLVAIAAAGLAVRVAYALLIGKDTSGIGDYFFYHGQANLLQRGRASSTRSSTWTGSPRPAPSTRRCGRWCCP